MAAPQHATLCGLDTTCALLIIVASVSMLFLDDKLHKMNKHMSSVIPARFLIITAHLVMTITILWSRDDNVKACLPLKYSKDEYETKDSQLVVGLSLAIAFIGLELLNFFAGISMFAPMTSLLSILSHSSACISLAYFIFDEWDCDLYWWIFGFCCVLPLIAEITVIIQVLVCKKGF